MSVECACREAVMSSANYHHWVGWYFCR